MSRTPTVAASKLNWGGIPIGRCQQRYRERASQPFVTDLRDNQGIVPIILSAPSQRPPFKKIRFFDDR
jgi:hypothetical protein